MMPLKSCKGCKQGLDIAFFKGEKGNIKAEYCITCVSVKMCFRRMRIVEASKVWQKENKDRANLAKKIRRLNFPEKYREKDKASREKNPSAYRKAALAHYYRNYEKVKVKSKKWRDANRDKLNAYSASWAAANPHLVAAQSAKRRAAKLLRTPHWLTEKDFTEIKNIYDFCRQISLATGEQHHVDHKLPLMGKFVSGLHVPANLQIIPASQNVKKRNTYLPT